MTSSMEVSTLRSPPMQQNEWPPRMKALILRTYPWCTGILAHPDIQAVFDSESHLQTFAAQLQQFENKLFSSLTRDAVGMRQLLYYDSDADNNFAVTDGNKSLMVELFVTYRVLDLLAREKGITGLAAVPSHFKNSNLGVPPKVGWNHINDWKSLLLKFQVLMANMPEGLPSGKNTSPLTMLGQLLTRNTVNKILLNVQIAAMHLADILKGIDFLESRPVIFLQNYISNAPESVSRADIDQIKALMKTYKGNQLRTPLHAAVMVSPLYLLAPLQLYAVKWDRQAMYLTSKGLGNGKPPVLVDIEKQLMTLLFRLACSETDVITEMKEFSAWLDGKLPDIVNEAPDSRGWFMSDSSSSVYKTSGLTMHLRGSFESPIFCQAPRRLMFEGVAMEHDGDGHMDNDGENMIDENRVDGDEEDEDRMDEDRVDGNRIDEDGSSPRISTFDDMDIDGIDEGVGCHQKADDGAAEESTSIVNANAGNGRMVQGMPAGDLAGNSEGDLQDGGNDAQDHASSVDHHGRERMLGTQRLGGMDDDSTIAINGEPRENHTAHDDRLGTAEEDVQRNDWEENDVPGQSSVAVEGNAGEDDEMAGRGTVAMKDVEGNGGENDNVDIDMERQVSVPWEDVEEIGGVEDGMEERDNASGMNVDEVEDTDALSSAAEEGDDEGPHCDAEKGKKTDLQKEEKPPVKKQNKDGSHGNAGLRKETAIDVDAFFHVEKISLKHEIKVKKYESPQPILAYGPDGRENLINFVTHAQEDTDRLLAFSEALSASFVDRDPAEAAMPQPVPLHVGKPETSIFRIVSQSAFDELSPKEILDILAARCIVVTDIPVRRMNFDAKGLSTLSTLSTVVPLQDQSRGLDETGTSYGNRLVQGTLQQLLECSQMEEGRGGKILNALQFPMPEEGLGANPFSTDSVAWCGTKGWRDCNDLVLPPTADIRWGLAATTGALHWWHIDSDGFGTYIDVKTGMKWWIVARPKQPTLSHDDFALFARSDIFMSSSYQMEAPCTSMWDLEAILLTPGTRLIMRPNQPHAVYTPSHAICHGGHFYAISTIQSTMAGFVHCFVSGNFVTNIEHSSSRLLLRRMAVFYHGAFVLGAVEKDGPAGDHVPDIEDFKSLLDVVTLCNLVILMNVLDGRTYQSDEAGSLSVQERLSCIYTRGKCIDLLNWIDERYRLRDPFTNEFDRCSWMMRQYFFQQISVIKSYKNDAENEGILGSDSALNCSAKRVSKELDMVAQIFPGGNKKPTLPSMTSTSLVWNGVRYDVERKRNSSCKKRDDDFKYYNNLGVTEGDRHFLASLAAQGESDRPNKRRRTS